MMAASAYSGDTTLTLLTRAKSRSLLRAQELNFSDKPLLLRTLSLADWAMTEIGTAIDVYFSGIFIPLEWDLIH